MTDGQTNQLAVWHVAFPVADLERSVFFYCGCLGFELVGRDPQSAFVSLGKGGFTIELLAPVADTSPNHRRAPDHIAFESHDLDAYRERLVTAGLEVPQITDFGGGMKRFALCDPDGMKLDFFQGRESFEAQFTV